MLDSTYLRISIRNCIASIATIRPPASKFLTGSSTRLQRVLTLNSFPSSNYTSSFKVEARKGEWLPGLASPGYLNGRFVPLLIRVFTHVYAVCQETMGCLEEDPENLKWFVQAELVNGRWAMLGVAGMLLPEVFTKIGIINVPEWYDAGKSEYFASSSTLFVIEFILFHYVEIRRWQDIKNPGSVNQDPIFKQYSLPKGEVGYPGGIFNPLNFASTVESKEKELANEYIVSEYALRGNLAGKADVYSYGVVSLEIVNGMSNISYKSMDEHIYLLDRWSRKKQ